MLLHTCSVERHGERERGRGPDVGFWARGSQGGPLAVKKLATVASRQGRAGLGRAGERAEFEPRVQAEAGCRQKDRSKCETRERDAASRQASSAGKTVETGRVRQVAGPRLRLRPALLPALRAGVRVWVHAALYATTTHMRGVEASGIGVTLAAQTARLNPNLGPQRLDPLPIITSPHACLFRHVLPSRFLERTTPHGTDIGCAVAAGSCGSFRPENQNISSSSSSSNSSSSNAVHSTAVLRIPSVHHRSTRTTSLNAHAG